MTHTLCKRHQTNLAKRQAREQREKQQSDNGDSAIPAVPIKKTVKIGRPGYKITKIRDPVTRQIGLLFQIKYPEIGTDVKPRYRLMSAFEQKVDTPPDKKYQYLIVAAEPYENCGFKLEALEIDRTPGKFWTYFDRDNREYFVQLLYKGKPRF